MSLCREKRLEHPCQYVIGHAGTGIEHFEDYVVSGVQLACGRVTGDDGYASAARHRIPRVLDEVHYGHFESVLVGQAGA